MGPAQLLTWLMVILLVLGAIYPSFIVYRNLKRCYSKCKKKFDSADITTTKSRWTSKTAGTESSENINIPKMKKFEFWRPDR